MGGTHVLTHVSTHGSPPTEGFLCFPLNHQSGALKKTRTHTHTNVPSGSRIQILQSPKCVKPMDVWFKLNSHFHTVDDLHLSWRFFGGTCFFW